jgi:flagellar basal body-associated protein FliL
MKKKLLPLILGIVLAGIGFGVYTMFLSGGGKPEPAALAQKKAQTALAAAKKVRLKARIEGPITDLGDPFIVNLADPNLGAFVKAQVSIMVDPETPFAPKGAEAATAAPVLDENTQIRDIVIDVLSSYSSSDLATPEGRKKMKEQLVGAINAGTQKTVCLNVYFTFFAIQAQAA